MKRFTATEKWAKLWYQELPPRLKCLWAFICDHADAAGAWEPNFRLASFQIGEAVTEEDMGVFGDKVSRMENGKWLIVSFVEFQYGKLSESCPAHKPVFRAIEKNRLLIPYQYPINRLQEEEEDKEEEKTGGAGGENPTKAKAESRTPETAEAKRVAKLFHRREATEWNQREIKQFKELVRDGHMTAENIARLEDYYADERGKGQKGCHRRDLLTFLNNFVGELDRANAQNSHSQEEQFRGV